MFLLAASNLPWELDMALLRRLEKRILVTLPNQEAREGMIIRNFDGLLAGNVDAKHFASALEVSISCLIAFRDTVVVILD